MSDLLSFVTIGVGAFVAASPVRAARIWGWKGFDDLKPVERIWYLRGFRVLGVLIGAAGILTELDIVTFH